MMKKYGLFFVLCLWIAFPAFAQKEPPMPPITPAVSIPEIEAFLKKGLSMEISTGNLKQDSHVTSSATEEEAKADINNIVSKMQLKSTVGADISLNLLGKAGKV